MIKGGKGGANTISGLIFENKVNIRQSFSKLKNYEIKEDNDLYYNDKIIAHFYKKHGLYSGLLKNKNINWKKLISKKLLPDDSIFIPSKNKLYIIEMKFQKTSGSVDEKLQTCHFKLLQYNKLLSPAKIKVEYIYLLNDWYKKPEYKDSLEYIKNMGCHYYFDKLPLKYLNLPAE